MIMQNNLVGYFLLLSKWMNNLLIINGINANVTTTILRINTCTLMNVQLFLKNVILPSQESSDVVTINATCLPSSLLRLK